MAEDVASCRAALAELAGAGWGDGRVEVVSVRDAADAERAVLVALRGGGVLVDASAGPAFVDDLIEDLARLGPVQLRTAGTMLDLDVDTWRLLHELARGTTLTDAARALHLSSRTANRRLLDARAALGVTSRAQLLRALVGPDRVPAAPDVQASD